MGVREKSPENIENPVSSGAGVAPHAGAWIETWWYPDGIK